MRWPWWAGGSLLALAAARLACWLVAGRQATAGELLAQLAPRAPQGPGAAAARHNIEAGEAQAGHTYFFSIGDFGVKACEAAYRAGDLEIEGGRGHEACLGDKQHLVAEAMARLAAGLRPSFVVSLGDNFYTRGVSSLDDPQFNVSFEDVYDRGALAGVPWKISLGDHDHCGNVTALLRHTQRSRRWQLPAPYYSFQLPVPGGAGRHIKVVVADSVGLEGGVEEELRRRRRFGKEYTEEFTGPATGAAQWSWLEAELAAGGCRGGAAAAAGRPSDRALTFIVAHRPVLSMVDRRRTVAEREVERRLRAVLASASRAVPIVYVSGHDHAMQLLEEEEGGVAVQYLGNGVGGMKLHNFRQPNDSAAPSKEFKWGSTDAYGFAVHEVGPKAMATHFVDAATGRVLRTVEVAFPTA